jgi:hypothetical protein
MALEGVQIIVPGANYSVGNVGVVGIAGNYFMNGGITNNAKQFPIAKFLKAFEDLGFVDKFDYIRIFCNTAQSDKLNVLNPLDTDAANRATFLFDSDFSGHIAHTNQGWEPYPLAGRRLISNYKIPAGTYTNFHMHAYATSAETNTTGFYFNVKSALTGNDLWVTLQRNSAGTTRAMLSRNGSSAYAQTTGISSNVGLLSGVINAGTIKLYDGGAMVATKAEPTGFVSAGDLMLQELTGNQTQDGVISASRTLFSGVGRTSWSDSDEANLNTILNTLKTDLATT